VRGSLSDINTDPYPYLYTDTYAGFMQRYSFQREL
jgi:hypothetical protein